MKEGKMVRMGGGYLARLPLCLAIKSSAEMTWLLEYDLGSVAMGYCTQQLIEYVSHWDVGILKPNSGQK